MYGTMQWTTTALACAVALTAMHAPGMASPRQPSGAELLLALDRLAVVGRVLYVAAHPDDENTRLLAWLENDKLVRTGYLSLTRGEGGQNLIGAEQAPLLGLIRTRELLAARAIDGAEQWFTRARDFGYSKSPDETLRIWDRDATLADVQRVMEQFHADVVITRFSPEPSDTHGHHTASAMLARDAFRNLPASSRPRRIVWNRGFFGGAPKPDQVAGMSSLDVGGYNPVLGLSYGEIAARSRSMHKSQGFGVAASRGENLEYFAVLDGEPVRQSIFDGIDLTWNRVPGGKRIAEHLARVRRAFDIEAPSRSIPDLVALRGEIAGLVDNPWKGEKLAAVDDIILACAGLWTDAIVADAVAVPGGDVAVTVTALNRSTTAITLEDIALPGGQHVTVHRALAANMPERIEHTLKVPSDLSYTQPYWLTHPPEPGHWTVSDPALIGLPEAPALSVELTVAIGTTKLKLARPLVYKWVDPVAGELERGLEILPPVTVHPDAPLLVFADAATIHPLAVRIKASAAAIAGELVPEVPTGWQVEPARAPFSLANKGDEAELTFRVHPPRGEASATLKVVAVVAGQRLSRSIVRVEYPHIPIQTVTPEADVKLVRADIHHKRTRIGYIPGAGDEVRAALRQVGYDVTALSDELLAHGSLAPYQAIVVGVRAFNVNPRLPFVHDRLMKYVADGGTLVVQYNTNNFISKLPAELGPAPFKITQLRVTDETAAVTFVDPKHQLLHRPNPIGEADFAGWVQERGLYFADAWDRAFQPVLRMHDPGEPEREGSLIVAKHGKGAFIYTGLAFFRQLPAGVPGAYRLFANLLDYAP
jgi:LmbE family N-acetylglucosaminyl deacetylase